MIQHLSFFLSCTISISSFSLAHAQGLPKPIEFVPSHLPSVIDEDDSGVEGVSGTGATQILESSKSLSAFFDPKSLAQLEKLKHSKDLSPAIYSAWIVSQSKVDEYKWNNPDDDPDVSGKWKIPAEISVIRHEFLGYLAGKLSVDQPNWWRRLIINCPSCHGCLCIDRGANRMRKLNGFVKSNRLLHKDYLEITVNEGNQILGVINKSQKIPFDIRWETDDSVWPLESVGSFDIAVASDDLFIFAIAHKSERESKIYCCRASGEIVWKNDGGAQDLLGNQEFNLTSIQIAVNDKIAVLFSANNSGVYLDVFEVETGKALGRFSTLLANGIAR